MTGQSTALEKTRKKIRIAEERIKAEASTSIIRSPAYPLAHSREAGCCVGDGRYVIPVKAEYRRMLRKCRRHPQPAGQPHS